MIDTLGNIVAREPEVVDFTIDGRCSQCGACCSDFLPVSQKEIERIHAYMKEHDLREHTTKVMNRPYMDMTCPFRDEVKHRCDIYEVRPEICRCFKCDQGMELITSNKNLLYRKNRSVSMRGEFFGNKQQSKVAFVIGAMLGIGG